MGHRCPSPRKWKLTCIAHDTGTKKDIQALNWLNKWERNLDIKTNSTYIILLKKLLSFQNI